MSEDGQWVDPEVHHTDDDGVARSIGLEPGQYLIAPAPRESRSFAPTKVDLTLGESRRVQLQPRATREVPIELRVVGETSGEPWGLPLDVSFERDDSVASILGNEGPAVRSLPEIHAPVTSFAAVDSVTTLRPELSPGRYGVNVRRAVGFGRGYIAPELEVTVPIEVLQSGASPRVLEVRAPDMGAVTVLEVGGAHSNVFVITREPNGDERRTPIPNGAFEPPRIWIDSETCKSDVELVHVMGTRRTVLASIPLEPGVRRVDLDPPSVD